MILNLFFGTEATWNIPQRRKARQPASPTGLRTEEPGFQQRKPAIDSSIGGSEALQTVPALSPYIWTELNKNLSDCYTCKRIEIPTHSVKLVLRSTIDSFRTEIGADLLEPSARMDGDSHAVLSAEEFNWPKEPAHSSSGAEYTHARPLRTHTQDL